jgi:hypothetical protein
VSAVPPHQLPAVHDRHWERVLTPARDENVPVGHGFSKPVILEAGQANPAAQVTGVTVPPEQKNPAGHCRWTRREEGGRSTERTLRAVLAWSTTLRLAWRHAVWPVTFWYIPGAHGTGAAEPRGQLEPRGQSIELSTVMTPLPHEYPPGQSTEGVTMPLTGHVNPGIQAVQFETPLLPVALPNVPGGQRVAEPLPGGQ